MGVELLITIVIVLLVVGLILGLAKYSGLIPEPYFRFAVIAVIILALLWLLSQLGYLT